MEASENRLAPVLNEKDIIELLENAKPGSIKTATKHGMKIIFFKVKTSKLYWQLIFKHPS